MQNILSKIILFRPVALRPGLSTGLPFLCAGGKVLPSLYREMSHRKTDQHKSCYLFLA